MKRKKRQFLNFLFEHNLQLEANIYNLCTKDEVIRVSIKYTEQKCNRMLRSLLGSGKTTHQAIIELADKCSGNLLIYKAYSDERKEIEAPTFG